MNTKIKQIERSIEKSEKRLQELEDSVLISIPLSKAFEMIELKKAIKRLKKKREDLINQSFKDQTGDPISDLRELFESFNPYNHN
jgi:Mg2+ and Co2+ transporter CorA